MKRSSTAGLIIVLLLGIPGALCAQDPKSTTNLLSGDEVGARLDARSQAQARELQEFEGLRVYRLQYRGFGGSRDAAMTVRMTFQAPANKQFTVVQQEGSKVLIDRVLKKLLQSEQEAMEEANRWRSALTLENYSFVVVDYENRPSGPCYVVEVTPRHANKFLYRGKIWVDAREFAVVHIEAEPARNPSFWIKKTRIDHDYVKIGDFWFPVLNHTETQTLFGGKASLTIDYSDYKIVSGSRSKRETAKQERAPACQTSVSSPCSEAQLHPLPDAK